MRTRQGFVLAALAGFAACSLPPLDPTFDQQTGISTVQVVQDGLLQRFELTPGQLRTGDTLFIRATVIDVGATRDVTTRICGLDLSGVDLRTYTGTCQGFSMQTTLAANDSVTGGDTRIVSASPGEYTLRVRYLLNPERWVEMKLRIGAR